MNTEKPSPSDTDSKTFSQYDNPLVVRYSSSEMSYIFSPQKKFSTWRLLWLWLAQAEKEVGLPISQEQLEEMQDHINDIDFAKAAEWESKLRHDVMAHVHTFAEAAPKAAGIIHLGATSAFVGDNTDLIQMRDALHLIEKKLLSVIALLAKKARETIAIPCLGYTHFQPAQPTTVGKRLCLYLQDLLLDYREINTLRENLPFRGIKGASGTQSSFLYLLEGNESKLEKIQQSLLKKVGFTRLLKISGQTYTRKLDYMVVSTLSGLAQSASKFSQDFRLMQHKGEWEEKMEDEQIGSSAMAYKRNPMKSERIGSLARFVISLPASLAYTASTQWFERTLDDSANKRLSVPQGFLAVDGILNLMLSVCKQMTIYPKVISRHLNEEMPFIMSENIMMAAVKKGGNRQKLHEVIRKMSFETAKAIRMEGKTNDLLSKMKTHSAFSKLEEQDWNRLENPIQYIGRSIPLANDFLLKEIDPILKDAETVAASAIKV